MILVQAVGAEAVDALAVLHAESFDDAWSSDDLRSILQSPGAFALAAWADEEPAGFVLCRVAAREAEVLTLATHPAHRRRSVATALLEAAHAICREGADAIFLEVAEDNPAGLALYRKNGYRQVGLRKAYYQRSKEPVAALILRRELNT